MKFAWDTASEQRPGEHMTTLSSGNGGAHTMVMKATFQLQVVWDSIAFCVKSGLPRHFKGCPSALLRNWTEREVPVLIPS